MCFVLLIFIFVCASFPPRLSLCEKALAEYLDTKRLAFPRFYFISSADLLDILSNGTDPQLVRYRSLLLSYRHRTCLLVECVWFSSETVAVERKCCAFNAMTLTINLSFQEVLHL